MYTGSFTPLGAARCSWVCDSCPFVPWGIVFTSVLIIALLRTRKPKCGASILARAGRYYLPNRHQFRRPAGRRLFLHLQNSDAPQQLFDAVIHSPQRLANVATVTLVAFASYRYAGSDKKRPVNRPNDLERGNRPGIASQRVTAV